MISFLCFNPQKMHMLSLDIQVIGVYRLKHRDITRYHQNIGSSRNGLFFLGTKITGHLHWIMANTSKTIVSCRFSLQKHPSQHFPMNHGVFPHTTPLKIDSETPWIDIYIYNYIYIYINEIYQSSSVDKTDSWNIHFCWIMEKKAAKHLRPATVEALVQKLWHLGEPLSLTQSLGWCRRYLHQQGYCSLPKCWICMNVCVYIPIKWTF